MCSSMYIRYILNRSMQQNSVKWGSRQATFTFPETFRTMRKRHDIVGMFCICQSQTISCKFQRPHKLQHCSNLGTKTSFGQQRMHATFCRQENLNQKVSILPFLARSIIYAERTKCDIHCLKTRRNFETVQLAANRKCICNFLLVINSNFGRISCRFRDIHV